MLTEEQRKRFQLSLFHHSIMFPGTIDSAKFYNLYYEFAEREGAVKKGEETAESEEQEREIFKLAWQRGYIGVIPITTVLKDDVKDFIDSKTSRTTADLFHIKVYEGEDEMNITDYWQKWAGEPPEGWFASYCTCGVLEPVSRDLSMFGNPDKTDIPLPESIKLEHVDKIDIMSNDTMRFTMDNGMIYKVLMFKQQLTSDLTNT